MAALKNFRISEGFICIASVIVFFFLDILDALMCVLFRFLDEFLERKPASCFCIGADEKQRECDGEGRLSDSLHGRRSVFREMGLPGNSMFSRKEEQRPSNSRWSDCGCESCVLWMRKGRRLHVTVQEPVTARPHENVIFVHGFLSSSSLWKNEVFPNLSEHSKQGYRLFSVDLLGFGKSPKPGDCFYTLRDHIEMIEKSVIRPHEVASFHLVAHSMGCVIALALAAKYSESVKSITLIAPPYFSSSGGDASLQALKKLTPKRVWPIVLFGSAFMAWYEHLGRCVCFIVCRHHRTWECILKLLTKRKNLHFKIVDLTCHTHRSAWLTMHNVVCGGAKFCDKYLEKLTAQRVKIRVVQGNKDQVVPLECSLNMKMKFPVIDLEIIQNADHNTVISCRAKDLTRSLESVWRSTDKKGAEVIC